jgi:hypothetical protein
VRGCQDGALLRAWARGMFFVALYPEGAALAQAPSLRKGQEQPVTLAALTERGILSTAALLALPLAQALLACICRRVPRSLIIPFLNTSHFSNRALLAPLQPPALCLSLATLLDYGRGVGLVLPPEPVPELNCPFGPLPLACRGSPRWPRPRSCPRSCPQSCPALSRSRWCS